MIDDLTRQRQEGEATTTNVSEAETKWIKLPETSEPFAAISQSPATGQRLYTEAQRDEFARKVAEKVIIRCHHETLYGSDCDVQDCTEEALAAVKKEKADESNPPDK